MPRKDNQALFHSILLHFHTISQLINLHSIFQQQGELPSVGRIELHLQKFITVLPQINKTLTASNHHPTLHIHNNDPKRRRPAGNSEVLSIQRQLNRQNLQRTYVSNQKVSSRIRKVEVKIGTFPIIRKNSNAPFVQCRKGLISPSLWMTT